MRSARFIAFVAALATSASLLSFAARAQSPVDASSETIDAVWKVQSVNFNYGGMSTSYSCGSLRKRVRAILMRMGAHESIEVKTVSCYDLSEFAQVQITMATPVEATAENVQALTQYDSKDELIARVRGEALGSAADVQRFPASWERIALSQDRKLRLAPGDCELVEQLRQQVLPLMSVQVVENRLRCSRAFGNYTRPQLTVAALTAREPSTSRQAHLESAVERVARAR